jgi:hypothetical protein
MLAYHGVYLSPFTFKSVGYYDGNLVVLKVRLTALRLGFLNILKGLRNSPCDVSIFTNTNL